MKIINDLKGFSRTFWVANTMELFERWAYYGFFMLFANYLTLSTDTGALGLSQIEKGIIMGAGTCILYLLPIFTGALADTIGFKRTLIISYLLYICSFLIMPIASRYGGIHQLHISGNWSCHVQAHCVGNRCLQYQRK